MGEYGIKLLDLGQETNAVSQKRVKDFKDGFPKDSGGSFCEKLWNLLLKNCTWFDCGWP